MDVMGPRLSVVKSLTNILSIQTSGDWMYSSFTAGNMEPSPQILFSTAGGFLCKSQLQEIGLRLLPPSTAGMGRFGLHRETSSFAKLLVERHRPIWRPGLGRRDGLRSRNRRQHLSENFKIRLPRCMGYIFLK